jgi:hypothetical protein
LLGCRTTLLPLAVSLTVLLLHRDLLRGRQRGGLTVAGLMVLSELPVEVGQLLIKRRLASVSSSRHALRWVSVARWRSAGSESVELLEADAT